MEEPQGAVDPSSPGPALPSGLTDADLVRVLAGAVPDVTVFVFGPDLRYRLVAGSAVTRLGWSEAELLGRRPAELMAEEDGRVVEEAMRGALAGETRTTEHPGIRDDQAFWESTVAPLHDPEGRVVGGMVVSCNTGPSRRAAAVRRQLEEAAVASARLVELERVQRERLEFLVAINEVIADCPDRRSVMQAVAQAAVPRLGDWCSISVFLDPRDEAPAVEVAHVDPSMVAYARELQERFPYDPTATTGLPQVIRSGEPEFFPEISDELLAELEVSPDATDEVRRLALHSAITVPLVKRRNVVGAMQFVLSGDDRRYTVDDLTLAQAVAGRVASAVENRRLAEQQRAIAHTLQRSLLPERLPAVPGVEVAVRYWAAGEGTEVGGDFYDVFPLDPGPGGEAAFGVVIGDVCGNGPAAATVTALARHTVRSAAWRGDGPLEVLGHLNRALLRADTDTMCTVAYGTLTGGSPSRFRVAVAGHPLPVLVRADGSAMAVGRPGQLLGAFEAAEQQEVAVEIGPGDVVVLLTDGAYDLPPPDALDPDRLVGLLARAVAGAPSAEQAAEQVTGLFDRHKPFGERSDDVALVVLRGAG